MDHARRILAETFGHSAFRAGQEEVVRALLEGRDALAVFPTGGGKSLCYQLPALLLDGLTLVVSPLIALMKDQVAALAARGIPAARWDSTMIAAEIDTLRAHLERGEIKLLYVSPERLSNESFRVLLKKLPVALLAIDEAHCISEWGHNFRPDYLKLARFRRSLKHARVLALTATATAKVAADIRRKFCIARGDVVILPFHRPNLDLRVTPCDPAGKKQILLERLETIAGPAVVYVTRQETTEEIATFLKRHGHAARAYHAGLPQEFRDDAQHAFMNGEVRVIVATIAFGMGIDKADIRYVAHYNMPKSLENYAQETGRAGRDGQPSICEMFASGADLITLENFIHADVPSARAIGNLLDRVLRLGDDFDISLYDLSVSCDIRPTVVETILTYLETEGVIEARGSFHGTFKARLLCPWTSLIAGRPPAERKFLAALWPLGEEKRAWRWFPVVDLAEKLGVKREKISAVLSDLAAAGDIALASTGVRRIYRRKSSADPRDLTEAMSARFANCAATDLARLAMVPSLSAKRGCLAQALAAYFGTPLETPCENCDRCRCVKPTTIRPFAARAVTEDEWQAVHFLKNENHAALATPRQIARFLCGMTSPAATRARLSRHDSFGLLADVPFARVLGLMEG